MIAGDWVDDAACKDVPPDDFFSDNKDAIARAVAFCLRCPVREKCLEFALATDTTYGMYGGCTPSERKRIADRRRLPVAARAALKNPQQVKDCPACNRALDPSAFAVDRSRGDGLTGECKACRYDRDRRRKEAGRQAS